MKPNVSIRQKEKITKEQFDYAFPYIKTVLNYTVEHPNEARALIYLWFPRWRFDIEKHVDKFNVQRILKKLIDERYVTRDDSAPGRPLFSLTPLGKIIAWGYISFVKRIDQKIQLDQPLGVDKKQAEIARKILKEIENSGRSVENSSLILSTKR